MTKIDLAELTARLTQDAQNLADLGVPLDMIGEAFVAVGLKFELAAHGPGMAAMRLATAASAMTQVMKDMAAQPPDSTTLN